MRKLVLILYLLQITSMVHAANEVYRPIHGGFGSIRLKRRSLTVSQLEQVLIGARGTPDVRLAQELSDLKLSERLSSVRAARLSAELPGPDSRRSLVVLADMSAFLDPPADEIPAIVKPDLDAQRKMIALTGEYLSKTLHRLPNFYATRETTSFRSKVLDGIPSQTMRPAGKEAWTVFYSNGGEKVRTGRRPYKKSGLTTNGEFGNILETVMDDAARGNLVWSHWEEGAAGPEAVYRFAITKRRNSHYSVNGLPSAYQGEIAINDSDGSIRRVVLKALSEPGDYLSIANTVVEYGPVDLGDKVYICPLKGVAVSAGAQWMWLNDVVFEDYHLFRANMRVLPTVNENP